MDKTVYVVIPCYNSSSYLDSTLGSVFNQSYKNILVVCINDGSTDNSLIRLQDFQKKHANLIVIDKPNSGIEYALKESLSLLAGGFVFLLGHDDTLSKDAIEKAVAAFIEDDSLDAVRTDLYFITKEGELLSKMDDRRKLTGKEAFSETLINWKIHTFCLWRTHIFKKLAEVETGGAMNFDELGTRYLYYHCRYVGFCSGIYYYYQNVQSVTKKFSVKNFDHLITDSQLEKIFTHKKDLSEKVLLKIRRQRFNNILWLQHHFFTNKRLIPAVERERISSLLKANYFEVNRRSIRSFYPLYYRMILLSNYKLFLAAALGYSVVKKLR